MLNGKCPNCGSSYRGWALTEARHQTCPKCGSALVVTTCLSDTHPQSVTEPRWLALPDYLAGNQDMFSHQSFYVGGGIDYGDMGRQ